MKRVATAFSSMAIGLALASCAGSEDGPGGASVDASDNDLYEGAVDASDEVNAAEMPDTFMTIETEGRVRSYEAPGGLVWIDMTDDGPTRAFVFRWCPDDGVTFDGDPVPTDCY